MQTNIEQVAGLIRALPLEEFGKLREVVDEEENIKRKKEEKLNWRLERYEKARKWLDENGGKYMNKWVCLEGNRLIAHGDDALEVHKEAIAQGIESPFVHHIVEEPKHYVGGW